MRRRSFFIVLIGIAGILSVAIFAVLRADKATPEIRAEKALRVLQSRLQGYVDENRRLPLHLDELDQVDVVSALRKQLDLANYDLLWLRLTDEQGILIAIARSDGTVRNALAAPVTIRISTSAPRRSLVQE